MESLCKTSWASLCSPLQPRELHQPPDLSKSEWHRGMGDRAWLQGSGWQTLSVQPKIWQGTNHRPAITSGEPAKFSRLVGTGTRCLRQLPHPNGELLRSQQESWGRSDISVTGRHPIGSRHLAPSKASPLPSARSQLNYICRRLGPRVPHLQPPYGTDPLKKQMLEVAITRAWWSRFCVGVLAYPSTLKPVYPNIQRKSKKAVRTLSLISSSQHKSKG